MCISKQSYTRDSIFEAIQATIACVQTTSKLWLIKIEDSDNGLFHDMASKLDMVGYEIKVAEYQGESIVLKTFINQAVVKGLILYCNIDFLPYSPNTPSLNTKFFNLFLGFKAKPATEINSALIDPITWHIENVWYSGDKNFFEYVINWLAYLVQYPEKKPRTVLVLRSPSCLGKNILTDFIGKEVLGPELFFASSDLGKILERFNSCIQAKKLILLNETGMISGEWQKANDHLKFLITEPYITIEYKGIEPKTIKDFAGYMVLSNHDAPLCVEMGDGRIVCLDMSPRLEVLPGSGDPYGSPDPAGHRSKIALTQVKWVRIQKQAKTLYFD